jgi:DNA gyrase subunit A
LLTAELTNGNCDIILATRYGYAVRFNEEDARAIGRTGMGVKGVTLRGEDDKVIGMICIDRTQEVPPTIMVVSENGYGKRTYLDDPETKEPVYRITSRGGKGVITMNITEKTGKLIAITPVADSDDLMIINRSGLTIRIGLKDVRVMGRNTQGVKLIQLKENDLIAAVAKVERDEEENTEAQTGEEIPENGTDINPSNGELSNDEEKTE